MTENNEIEMEATAFEFCIIEMAKSFRDRNIFSSVLIDLFVILYLLKLSEA